MDRAAPDAGPAPTVRRVSSVEVGGPVALVVAGQDTLGTAGTFDVTFPYDSTVVATVGAASAAQMNSAIAGAAAAAGPLSAAAPFERADVLRAVAEAIERDAVDLAAGVTLETGKPITEAEVEVRRAAPTMRLAAEEATRIGGTVEPIDAVAGGEGRWAEARWFPLGPVAAITPFNSPLNLVAHKIGAAIAAGNPIIVKPAPATPLSALSLGRLTVASLDDHRLPAAAVSVLPCGDDVADRLVTDRRIKAFQFTGSTGVGWQLASRAVLTSKRLLLELGGNGATIVHRDADVAHAAARCSIGGFLLAGQVCASVQRILVHRDVADTFLSALVGQVRTHVLGDPRDRRTTLGPMINAAAASRAERWVADAVAAGAELLVGGPVRGTLFPATVLTGTDTTMQVACEEVFAPVVTVERYDDFDEAIAEADRPGSGLQVGLFTSDLTLVRRLYSAAHVGSVIVNDVNSWRVDPMPFGGWGTSGYGREGLRREIRQQMDERLLVQTIPPRPATAGAVPTRGDQS